MIRQSNSRFYLYLIAAGFLVAVIFSLHNLNKHDRLPSSVHETINKLNPFHPPVAGPPTWLIATIIRANDVQRRHIIRSTWQRLYANDTRQTTRFVISDPGPLWQAIVQAENDTYGDIISLTHLEEKAETANTIKSIEFIKYLANQDRRWKFVTKVDDDSFIEANAFYETYLQPLLAEPLRSMRTMIARTVGPNANYDFTYPGGQFYTMTWDLVPLLADLYDKKTLSYNHEDALVGGLLKEAGISYTHVDLQNDVAFDYDATQARHKDTAWAPRDANLMEWSHAMGPGAVNPHKMKTDEDYLKVAACFDWKGLRTHEYLLRGEILIEDEPGNFITADMDEAETRRSL